MELVMEEVDLNLMKRKMKFEERQRKHRQKNMVLRMTSLIQKMKMKVFERQGETSHSRLPLLR